MRFTTPLAFLLLLTIPYLVWLGQPRAASHRWRDWFSLGLRTFVLLLLILSLAGSQLVRAADDLAVVFLVDASDSIDRSQSERAEQFIRQAMDTMGPTDQAAVVLFGANALVDRPMSSLTELSPITTVPQRLQTDLARAIQLGLALFPAGSARRLVVLSDGQATLGDTLEASKLAAASGVTIDYVYLSRPEQPVEVTLLDVRAPTRVSLSETFRLEITAESSTNQPASLRVLAGSRIIYDETVQLRPGSNNFAVRLQATEQEFARYRVQIIPVADTFYQNNELAAFTEVVGQPRILLVSSEGTTDGGGTPLPAEAPQLLAALAATGLEIEHTSPTGLPAELGGLNAYASVVLVNINAKNLSLRQMAALQSYVRDLGGGLVVVGGPQSYGMGGYFRTPLEETLPVDMQIKDQDRFPAVSLAIIIDRSGSMSADEGGITKIQLAAEGAVRAAQLLNDFDDITVLPVDTVSDNPIGPLPASERETAVALIRQIGAGGGGIYVRTGLQAAAAALAQSSNEIKHIILLADGADAEEKEGVPALIESLTAQGMTISTVSIGRGADTPWLEQMAELGNGRFHFTDRAANLPQIFTQETAAIQRSYLVEERFFAEQVGRSPILAGIRAVPPLFGYVATVSKDAAQVILQTPQGDPLLAVWQYGLGRALAWTSDATGRWAAEWVPWNGFAPFWAQAVRWSITQGRDSSVETVVTLDEGRARLAVDARDSAGAYLNVLALEANVVGPDGRVIALTLPQIAPGRYEGTFVPQVDGAYFIRVAGMEPAEAAESDPTAVVGQTVGWVLGYSPEYRRLVADPELLQTLAAQTGGRDLTEGSPLSVFAHNLPSEPTTRPVWPWLTLLAVLLLPLDIATRRLVLTRQDWERVWGWLNRHGSPNQPALNPARAEQLSQLFAAKKRAGGEERAGGEGVTTGGSTDIGPPASSPEPAAQAKPASVPKPADVPSGTLASRLRAKRRPEEEGPE